MSEQARDRLVKMLRRRHVVELGDLYETLATRSRMTVFRRLREVGYRTSFTHRCQYYTLAQLPQFDQWGLWFHGEIGFSRCGTLKETTAVQVETAPDGRTHGELSHLLRVRVHNPLLDLVREGRIGRERYQGQHLYVSADADRAAEQVRQRLEGKRALGSVRREPTLEETIEILAEALRGAAEIPAPLEVMPALAARGLSVDSHLVQCVYAAHELSAGKKRRRPPERLGEAEKPIAIAAGGLRTTAQNASRCADHHHRGAGSVPAVRGRHGRAEDCAPLRPDPLEHGSFEARERVHVCAAGCHHGSGAKITRRAACLSQSLPVGQTVGYDVVVFVGLQRFVHYRQREEVREALRAEHGVEVSSGEVSILQRRFVLYLQRLHVARREATGQAFAHDGGWPLHIDATGEDGRGTLLNRLRRLAPLGAGLVEDPHRERRRYRPLSAPGRRRLRASRGRGARPR
jgi:hypothetical protein